MLILMRGDLLHEAVGYFHYGPEKTTRIVCIDSLTEKPVEVSASSEVFITSKGESPEDDPYRKLSVASIANGTLQIDHNVDVQMDVMPAGYQKEQVRLNGRSPPELTLRLHRK